MNALRHVFAAPWAFYLLMVFPVLTIVQLFVAWRKRRLLPQVGAPFALIHLLPPRPRFRWLVSFALTGALSALAAGIAAPHWGRDPHPDVVAGRDVIVVLDMSKSMKATDAPPTRFDRARQALLDLTDAVQHRGGHRLGLVVFAAEAQVVVPLTHDYNHVRGVLETLDIDRPPSGLRPRPGTISGTRIGGGLRMAVSAHDPAFKGFQDILLLSDGDDPVEDDDWVRGLSVAQQAEIPVYTVGIGDPDRDSIISIPGHDEVPTRLKERPLREIARRTSGHYLAAQRELPRLAEFFHQRIESKGGTTPEGDTPNLPQPQQVWFYAAALGLWVIVLLAKG
ncbi:MAG: vWA domain-containing protein [Gemmataceae bacterium]